MTKNEVDSVLSEEEETLRQLEDSLRRSDELTKKAEDALNIIDDRLIRLEDTIMPIYKSTQYVTRLNDRKGVDGMNMDTLMILNLHETDIDKSIHGFEKIIAYLDVAAKEEHFIVKGWVLVSMHSFAIVVLLYL